LLISSVLYKIRRKAEGFGRGETPSRGQEKGKSATVRFVELLECWLSVLFCGIWYHEEHNYTKQKSPIFTTLNYRQSLGNLLNYNLVQFTS